jgi:hypothetical protein
MAHSIKYFAQTAITPTEEGSIPASLLSDQGVSSDCITGELGKIFSKPPLPKTVNSVAGV